jgi:hypothetical protein
MRPLYEPVAPSGAQNEPGRRLATTGDPPGATVVEVLADATVVTVVVAVDRPAVGPVVEGPVDETVVGTVNGLVAGAVAGAPATTSDQPRIVVPAH